ncbi:chaperonin 10-like protein [Aspergillus varians]
MSTDYKFEGWLGLDSSSADGNMQWKEFEPKPWEETDVDIKISHCGVCGSDLHTLRSGWGPTNYPCCVGHEIIGTAIRVGTQVSDIKIGDRVGVGAQSESCLNRKGPCEECANSNETYCVKHFTGTYNGVYMNGGKSYGGYALYNRSPAHFVIKIPESLPSASAAPMMCGGVTVYSPLKHYGCGPGKKVGIIGIGGLGHFGVLFAKALGADEVIAISRKADKREDALKMGASLYVSTQEDTEWMAQNKRTLDLIVCTVSSSKMPINDYVSLLKVDGTFTQVGVPEDGALTIPAFTLVMNRVKLGGSLIGSPSVIREMLQLAADKNVQPWIEERPMKEANQAIKDMGAGDARYRYVLVNEN